MIRFMTQNIDLSCGIRTENDLPTEYFLPSDVSTLHAIFLNMPETSRTIVYKKKVEDKITNTWSWCFFILSNDKPISFSTKTRRSPRYSENGYGNNITFSEYNAFSDEKKNLPFLTNMTDSLWCSELDTDADTFPVHTNETWENSGVSINTVSIGHSSNILFGNFLADNFITTEINNATPFLGLPLEQMRAWDSVFDYNVKPTFYNGNYKNYSLDFSEMIFGRDYNSWGWITSDLTNSSILYDKDNPLKKTEIGEHLSPFGYKKNDFDEKTLNFTYQDYIDFIMTNASEMIPRYYQNTGHHNNGYYLDHANYYEEVNVSDITIKALKGDMSIDGSEPLFIPCGNWYIDNVYISTDYDACKKYIETGEIPADATIHKINADGTENKEPSDNDNPSNENQDGSKRENQAENNPTVGAVTCGAVNYYYMSETQMSAFFKWFWTNAPSLSDVVENYITGIYNNLSEMITGVFYFPCSAEFLASSFGQGNILIGRYPTGIPVTTITGLSKNIKIASKKIENYFNSFLDYDGYTKIQLYLPYFGIVNLPTNTVMGTTLEVFVAVDVSSCTMSYIVKSGGVIVFETSVPFGLNIPISLSSSMEKATNTLNSVIGLGSSIAMSGMMAKTEPLIGAMSATNAIANFHSPTPEITVKGNTTSFSGQWQPQKCALIIQRPITAVPTNYGSKVGYCLNKAYKLGDLNGFTICENPQITFNDKKPLKSEQEEIYALLERGVIL